MEAAYSTSKFGSGWILLMYVEDKMTKKKERKEKS